MNKEKFIEEIYKLGLTLTEDELSSFEIYKTLLQEYNKKFNLTAIIEDDMIYLKHFYDSICLTKAECFKDSIKVLDIGVGAGFPSIPLAIIYKDKEFTLVESNGKKTNFLNIVKEKLNLTNITIINERAEDYAKNNKEQFDIATSRAVSHLYVLSELELPTLKINGYFLPMKANIDEEIKESKEHLKSLGGTLENIITYTLPIEDSKRAILLIKKMKETNYQYPRDYSKITKELKNIKR